MQLAIAKLLLRENEAALWHNFHRIIHDLPFRLASIFGSPLRKIFSIKQNHRIAGRLQRKV